MSVILILILASLAVALAFLGGFIWAVKSGQFEDTCTPAMRILSEDETGKAGRLEPGGAARRAAEALKRLKGYMSYRLNGLNELLMSEALARESSNRQQQTGAAPARQVETFKYDNRIVRAFAIATVVWGLVGMAAGLLVATQMFWPAANLNLQFITFGRLRPLHTNAVIFAFVGNGMFMGIYYSLQRLCKARMFSDLLELAELLGLAGHHRQRRDHAAAGLHLEQGIRRAGVAD